MAEAMILVGLDRLELSTSPLSGVRSSHLSYRPGLFQHKPEARELKNILHCRPERSREALSPKAKL